MSERAGVVSVDVEPGLQAVGSKIDAYMRALRPFGFKAELASNISKDLDKETRAGQRSLDSMNTRKAQGELRTLGQAGDRELGRLGARIDLSGQQMAVLGGGAIVAGGQILRGLRPAIDAAADLKETTGAAANVFGEQLGKVEKIATGAATAVGLSRTAALQALNTFGNYADVAGKAGDESVQFSDDLVALAADLGAAWNTDTPEAIAAIGSALRGEMDPIERYGIFLQEATLKQEALRLGLITTTTEALEPQAKVLAANSLILQQGAKYAGTFAREASGVNGQLKIQTAEAENAKASIGEGLTDGMSKAIAVGRGLLSVIGEIPGGLQAVGFAAAGLGVTSILGGSITSILGARKMLKELISDRRAQKAAIGPDPAEAATAATSVGTVAAAMDGVTASSTRAGAAGSGALTGIRTQAIAATAAVVGTSTAIATVGSDLDRLRTSAQETFSDSRGLPAADFIDGEVLYDSFDDLAAIGPGAASAVTGVGTAAAATAPKVSRLSGVVTKVGTVGKAAFGQLTSAATLAGGVFVGLPIVESIAAISNELRGLDVQSRNAMDLFVANIDKGRVDILSAFNEIAAVEDGAAGLGDVFKSFGTEFSFAGVTGVRDLEYYQQAFDKLKASVSTTDLQTFIDQARDQNEQLDHTSAAYIETNKLLNLWQGTVDNAAAAQEHQTRATKVGGDALDRFGFKIDQTKGKYEQYADTLNNLFDPSTNAVDAVNERIDADREVAEAEQEVARARAGGVADAKEAADAERDLADAARDVTSAKRSQAAAYRDLADANRDLADLEAELAHVDPLRDPNRYRELSEKVRDARDAQLDAQDRVASAAESVQDAEQRVTDARDKAAGSTDGLVEAEQRLEDARERQRQAILDEETALAAFNDAMAASPELIAGTFAQIDEWARRGKISADAAERWKNEILGVIAASQQLPEVPGVAGAPSGKDAGDQEHAARRPTTGPGTKPAEPKVISDSDAYGIGISAAAHPGGLSDGDVYSDRDNRPWRYRAKDNKWVAQFATGGRVAGSGSSDSELIAATPDEYVIRADTARRIGYSNLDALNEGRLTLGGNATSAATIPASTAATFAAPSDATWGPALLEEIRGMRQDIANLERTVYAPRISVAEPSQVRPTMAEALRESRSDSWTNHGAVSG